MNAILIDPKLEKISSVSMPHEDKLFIAYIQSYIGGQFVAHKIPLGFHTDYIDRICVNKSFERATPGAFGIWRDSELIQFVGRAIIVPELDNEQYEKYSFEYWKNNIVFLG